jgi:hypothetical protein
LDGIEKFMCEKAAAIRPSLVIFFLPRKPMLEYGAIKVRRRTSREDGCDD